MAAKNIKDIGHPEFLQALPDYVLVRDCFLGSRKVKDAGTTYLPSLGSQTYNDYDNYKTRALFFPITGKTVSSLVGLATTKAAKLVYPPSMKSMFEDTLDPFQFLEMQTAITQELLLQGRYGMLIDGPANGTLIPQIYPYVAENIVNWELDPETENLNWVLLREMIWVQDPKNVFGKILTTRYRWCGLENGTYEVRLYDDQIELQSTVTPLFQGKSIDFVPFVCVGSTGVHVQLDNPPMLDIATINIAHYLNSADLEWGRHFCGLPTPVVSGVDSATKDLVIGSTVAWIIPEAGGKAYYLEFQGQGLQSLENGLKEKISLMASISARLVDSSANGSESPQTVKLRYQSETSTLNQILNAAESGLQLAYSWVAQLSGEDPASVGIKLSHDVMDSGMDAATLRELFTAYLNGSISKDTLVFNLRRSDFLDPNVADDEIIAAMVDQPTNAEKLAATIKPEPVSTPAPPPAPATK